MPNRFKDAYMIQQGACNPGGIARALVQACDEAMAETRSTDAVCHDPAVRMIAHQLAFLLNLNEYDHSDNAYGRDYAVCQEQAGLST